MSEILEQAEIDRLQFALSEVAIKKELSMSAIQKIKQIYFSVCKQYCEYDLEDMEQIGKCISDIGNYIRDDNEYLTSFTLLRNSYIKRLK